MADQVTTPVVAPVEGAAAPVVEETPAAVAPVEGAPVGEAPPPVEKTPEELAAEVEAKAAADAKFTAELPELLKKIPEAELRKLGLQHANRTMAAARRAERAVDNVQRENVQLKAQLASASSGPDFKKDPRAWMKANGFDTAKELVDHMLGAGGEPAKPDPLDEVAKLRKEREDEKAAIAAERQAAEVEVSKGRVAAALGKDPAKFHYASKPTGVSRLWGEIEAYHKEHGACPDAAVFHLANEVEREMRAEFGEPARPAAKVTTPTGAAKPAGSAAGGDAATITAAGSGGAPVVRVYSDDPDERRRQINEELVAEGLLQKSTG